MRGCRISRISGLSVLCSLLTALCSLLTILYSQLRVSSRSVAVAITLARSSSAEQDTAGSVGGRSVCRLGEGRAERRRGGGGEAARRPERRCVMPGKTTEIDEMTKEKRGKSKEQEQKMKGPNNARSRNM